MIIVVMGRGMKTMTKRNPHRILKTMAMCHSVKWTQTQMQCFQFKKSETHTHHLKNLHISHHNNAANAFLTPSHLTPTHIIISLSMTTLKAPPCTIISLTHGSFCANATPSSANAFPYCAQRFFVYLSSPSHPPFP